MAIATLLTDFGTVDYYVAAVKGTLLRLAPGCELIDISHQVSPGNIIQASFLLAAAAPTFPKGTVHLAVVDPGVGSERRILVAEHGGHFFLAPDNGLLTPFFGEAPSSPPSLFAVDRPDLYLPSSGSTFHGRDRFAPVAAFLLRGGATARLGAPVSNPRRLIAPCPQSSSGVLTGRVVHIDRFGNLITDVPTAWLGKRFEYAEIDGHRAYQRVDCYSALPAGEAGVIPGSLSTLELSLDGASLAERWKVSSGTIVRFHLGC